MTETTTTKGRRVVVEFDDSLYRISHGTAPRGRGTWAFAESVGRHKTSDDILWAPGSMTLTEAKRWARAHYVAAHAAGPGRGVYVVVCVMP